MKARRYLFALVLVVLVAGVVVVTRIPRGEPAPATTSPQVAVEAGAGVGDPYYPTDGNSGYDVTQYDLSISYDPGSKRLDGVARVTATAADDLSRFNLDLLGLQVSDVKVGDQPAKFAQEGDHELVITPSAPLAKGRPFTTTVTYGGTPQLVDDDSLGRSGWQISTTGGAFAAGQPHSATTWFPANDTPRDKAKVKIAARVPDGWSVISNGIEGAVTKAGGWTTYNWAEDTPMATYLVTVAIDKWTVVRSTLPDGTPVVDAYAPGTLDKRAIEGRLPEVIGLLSSKFGPYPQRAAGGIFVADRIGFSLETQTRPTYAQWADLETIVHETAHQWFGDSVSLKNWADICLNECLASYSQWLWAEAKDGENLDNRYRTRIDELSGKTGFWAQKLYDMGRGNEFRGVYDKGILAMHALRRKVGDQAFFQALTSWTAEHREGNASWPEFEDHVEKVSGQQLDAFYQAWFRDAGIPADEHLRPGSLRR
ncbi:M1 family metallopeptidase [Lentzea tibetensis]|uniref:Aminopeptidase N n=1 Tax=Lentzea tibetensis TaxID=2591470 RepID=A0A563EVJ4_9PSEU|nr:M1 family metallopeptidase [Lentzea tibetensis]TWP51174.1 M1 family metallopeptidase [Lentzea tibetensis]